MENTKISKKKLILISIIPYALALFFIINNAISLIMLNTTSLTIENLQPDDIKKGAYISGKVNGEVVMSCLEVENKLKGGMVDYGKMYYYISSYYENEDGFAVKYIPFNVDENLYSQLALYDDTMVIPANKAPIYVKGKLKKLDEGIKDEILKVGKDLFGAKDIEKVDEFIEDYYIDTTVEYSSLIKLIIGVIIAIITTILLMYKISTQKGNTKAKIYAYIAIPFLLAFIIIVFMNSALIFS